MSQLLSVVVPARNSQANLVQQVNRLLELLPDLVANFEIMIVDDASIDQTEEVALDLAHRYPQVSIVRHPRQMGLQVAIRTGIQRTTGDIVFVQDDPTPVSSTDLRKLWELRDDEQVVMAETNPEPLNSGLIHRLMEWGDRLKQSAPPPAGGLRMIRRRAVIKMSQANMDDSHLALQRLDRADLPASGSRQDRSETKMKFDFHQV